MTRRPIDLVGALSLLALLAACAQTPQSDGPAPEAPPLRVAVVESPPFAIRRDDGSWSGASVAIWEDVVERLGRRSVFEPLTLQGAIDGVASGGFDAAIGAIAATSDHADRVDFSHPFHEARLGVAVRHAHAQGFFERIAAFVRTPAALAVAAMGVLLVVAGLLVWMFERRRSAPFAGSARRGVGASMWWSASTMTTVGPGETTPMTAGGRIVAIVWMLVSVVAIAALAGLFASVFTVAALNEDDSAQPIQDFDFETSTTGVVAGSWGSAQVRRGAGDVRQYESIEAALAALSEGEVDAVAHDGPILRHLVRSGSLDGVRVLEARSPPQSYAFALPPGSELRREINQALLRTLETRDATASTSGW